MHNFISHILPNKGIYSVNYNRYELNIPRWVYLSVSGKAKK